MRALAVAAVLAVLPPGPLPAGQPGGNGPCGMDTVTVQNEWNGGEIVYVISPTGHVRAPTGGRCDGPRRPGVFFAHGYSARTPLLYDGLVRHLVSLGHVVVYASYPIAYNPPWQYATVDAGFRQGAAVSGRVDLAHVGFAGHSFGAGMTPRMVQLAAARGWGSRSLWMAVLSPHFALEVGSGPIHVPPRTQALVIAYETDEFVDNRIGIEIFESLDLPDDHKQHVTLRTDGRFYPPLYAGHMAPNSIPLLLPEDSYDFYGLYRNLDVLAACARHGRHCGADLSWMGTWSDGVPVTPASSSDDPVDLNPPALQDCDFFLNPRPCPAPREH